MEVVGQAVLATFRAFPDTSTRSALQRFRNSTCLQGFQAFRRTFSLYIGGARYMTSFPVLTNPKAQFHPHDRHQAPAHPTTLPAHDPLQLSHQRALHIPTRHKRHRASSTSKQETVGDVCRPGCERLSCQRCHAQMGGGGVSTSCAKSQYVDPK
jgi:hypothetical protein